MFAAALESSLSCIGRSCGGVSTATWHSCCCMAADCWRVWKIGVQEPYQPGPYLPDSEFPHHWRLLCHQQVMRGIAAL